MYGRALRFMRVSKRLKQTEVSKYINVSNSTLAHYESELRAVTFETTNLIAEACGYEILFRDKEKNKIYRINEMKVDYDIWVTSK